MENPIEEIKNKLDIVDVVNSYIKLKKAGVNYQACCPFHSEKKPSFFVSPVRQMWKCFGCSKGGDIFAFVKQIEGVEFGDALRILAQRAGVELRRQDPELQTARKRLYEICELSCQFFEKQLGASKMGKQAQEYFLKRGIELESQKAWRLGYAPDSWNGLNDFLIKKRYTKEEIIKAGVAVKNDKGNFFDRFRRRMMFPIFDLNSQVIGFSGRVLLEQDVKMGKYVNTPATILYDKGRTLYGLNKAKVEIRRQKACILVEGNIDLILSHQMGIKNIVATCGTALTPYQLDILKRYSENLILAFDMDVAGDTATKRGIDLAQEKGFDIKVVVLPDGKDPANVIADNPENWGKALDSAKAILDFYFNNAFAKFDQETAQGKKEISKILLPVLKRIPNKIVKFHWIQKLAQELKTREKDILDELEKVKIEKPDLKISISEKRDKKNQQDILEQRLIFLILKDIDNMVVLEKSDLELFSTQTNTILSCLQNIGLDFDKLKKTLSPDSFEKLNTISMEVEAWRQEEEDDDCKQEFTKCLNRIRDLKIKNELRQISEKIKQAETQKQIEKIKLFTEEFNELAKKLST